MKHLISKPTVIPKAWGREEVICNNANYCGKRLIFNAGAKFSMHAHRNKHETFYVVKGALVLRKINTDDASEVKYCIAPGDVVEIPPMLPHQLIAVVESEVIEFSTHHEDSDSYRYEKGDSQA